MTRNIYNSVSRRKVKFLLTIFVLVSLGLIVSLTRIQNSSSSYINKHDSRISETVLEEMRGIVSGTPYLWRQTNLSDRDTPIRRIVAQRKWIQRISTSAYVNQSGRVKTIILEDNPADFYVPNKMYCPFAKDFENKCNIEVLSFLPKTFRPLRYYWLQGDAVISIRNWEKRVNYKIPQEMLQIMFILEPPGIAKGASLGYNNALLASYSRGSDIPIPYRVWRTYSSNMGKDLVTRMDDHKLLKTKTKFAAAIVSNCDNKDRLEYIHQLQEYVQVDVFGKCGNFSCEKRRNKECLETIGTTYKFFLSFENSKCEDYITEKSFENALQYNIVPVVMGARPEDYHYALPPNSYINADQFNNPKELAEYLKFLDGSDEDYLSYLEWKYSRGTITSEALDDFFCRVCGMLYYADFVPVPTWQSWDVTWKDINKCLPSFFDLWPKEQQVTENGTTA